MLTTEIKYLNWKADYDVVVIGFGAAGATAARFAADHKQKVLLIDSAPYGYEGGNSRYCGQIVGTSNNFNEMKKYYEALTKPMNLSNNMINTYVQGMVDMSKYFKKYLCPPVSFKKYAAKNNILQKILYEYPEFPGVKSYDFTMVTPQTFNSALWKLLQQKIIERSKYIDVWLKSPARHLIQDSRRKVVGVQVQRKHQRVYVHAKKGIVLSCGGFENNKEMIQNYLGAEKLLPVGSLYDRGDGIKLAKEVGAKLWHMRNYESSGFTGGAGLIFAEPEGKRGHVNYAWFDPRFGSTITVGDDGRRYFNENEQNRHGHIYTHGQWRNAYVCSHPYMIFDQTKRQELSKKNVPVDNLEERMIKADTLSELAHKIKVPAKNLEETVKNFNFFAKEGHDYEYHRDAKSMRAFDNGPYYALALEHVVLNTQGGPQRDEYARILDPNNQPISHLYGAGELGGICANQYQGGMNIAECLIWSKIAGDQVSMNHNDNEKATTKMNNINDLIEEKRKNITVGPNQFLGSSENGIGGRITTRVTYQNKQIKKVEIVENHESKDIARKALTLVPQEIVKNNSTDVDVVSGATMTSKAIQEAVQKAITKAK